MNVIYANYTLYTVYSELHAVPRYAGPTFCCLHSQLRSLMLFFNRMPGFAGQKAEQCRLAAMDHCLGQRGL